MAVNIGPRIGIDGESEYRKQIQNIIQETKTLKSEYERLSSSIEKGKTTLKQNAEQHKILGQEIEAQQKKVNELANMVDQASAKFGEADPKTQRWKQALNEATTQLNNMQTELKNLPNDIQLIGEKMEAAGNKIKSAGEHLENFGRSLAPVSAAATGALAGSTKAAIDFETAMTGVKKTNDELVDSNGNVIISYDDLADSIKEMSTRTASSKSDIAGVMEAAGQLGVGTEYLTDFTETMIMLGDSTNLSADEAASAIAKFANVTQMSLSDSDRLGAVIVDLGNNFATTEQDIVAMATRLSGAGHQVGLTEAQIMGFATALSSVGIEAEMGGSAFSKAMIKMQVASETGFEQVQDLSDKTGMSLRELELYSVNNSAGFKALADSLGMTATEMKSTIKAGTNLNDFAEVAGMSTEKFVQLYRDDAPAALQAFISGLGDTESHGESTIQMLEEMGFTEVRLRDTLTRLASSGDLVTRAIETGNVAWEENSALQDEAEKKYGTTAAQISQAKEKLTNLGIEIGERLLPYVDRALDYMDKIIDAWDNLSPEMQDMVVKSLAVAAVASPVVTGAGKITSSFGSITSFAGKTTKGLGGLVKAFSGSGGLTSAAGGVSGAMSGAGASIGAIAGPAAIAVAAVAVLGGAFVTAYKQDEEFASEVQRSWSEIQSKIKEVIDVVKPAWEAFSKAISPVFIAAMDAVSGKLDAIKKNIQGWIDIVGGIFSGDWKRIMKGVGEVVTSVSDNVINTLKFMANSIKGIFEKLEIKLPDIKLPHFKVSGEDKFGLPKIHIDWYAKAMNSGMRLDGATIFGAAGGKLLGGGEAGKEWIVGENSLMGMIRSAVRSAYIPGGNEVNIGDTNIIINAAEGQDVQELAERVGDIINARLHQAEAAWA